MEQRPQQIQKLLNRILDVKEVLARVEEQPQQDRTNQELVTCHEALDGVVNQTINGTSYVRVAALQSPFFLEFDDNKRYLFAVNFTVTKAV